LIWILIEFIDHDNHAASRSHGDYWIPRIQLHFLAEDPRIFADRVAKAYHDRKRTEAELRSALFIDCMPIDGIGKLDDERIKRMIELTKTSAISKTVYVLIKWFDLKYSSIFVSAKMNMSHLLSKKLISIMLVQWIQWYLKK
jgi:hypothetical protein